MSKDGYSDSTDTITMEANQQHPDFIMSMEKAVVPAWVTLVVAIIILLIAIIAIVFLLATRIKGILAPVSKALRGFTMKPGSSKADREAAKAHKAEAAKQDASKRETIRARQESTPGDNVDMVNVDPVRRKREPVPAEERRKEILDFDLKHIADGVPKKIKAREPIEARRRGAPSSSRTTYTRRRRAPWSAMPSPRRTTRQRATRSPPEAAMSRRSGRSMNSGRSP